MTKQELIGLIKHFTDYLKDRLIDKELDEDTGTTIEDIIDDYIVGITYDIEDCCEIDEDIDEKLNVIEYYLKGIFVKGE